MARLQGAQAAMARRFWQVEHRPAKVCMKIFASAILAKARQKSQLY
jgi:hypothetical protein